MARGGRDDSRLLRFVSRHRWDICGIGVIVVLTAAYLSPALWKGSSFGGFDLDLRVTSLGSNLYPAPHNVTNSDVVSQLVAWNLLDWRFVHAGHIPLWNEYSLLGTPLFLNFQSSAFSLPALVSYLVPVRSAYLVVVAVRLIVAGTGIYTFSRVAGLRPPGATFAAATFILSGPFANWLSWPLTDVVGWMGWIAAFSVLAYRRPERRRYVVLLAVSVAFSTYAGFPEGTVFVAGLLAVMAAAFALAKALERRRARTLEASGPPDHSAPAASREPRAGFAWRGVARVAFAGAAGTALAAPLWLPGEQILRGAFRLTESTFQGLPLSSLSLLFSQGYYGLPTKSGYFGPANYYESVSYVGVIALVLAGVAVLRWWRSALVLALVVTLLAGLVATYQTASFHPFESVVWRIHFLRSIDFARSRTAWVFPFAVLAGIGCDTVLVAPSDRRVRRAYLVAATIAVVTVAGLVVVALGRHLPPPSAAQHDLERHAAVVWPAALAAIVIAFGAALVLIGRRVRSAGRRGAHSVRSSDSASSRRPPRPLGPQEPAVAGFAAGRGWRIGAFAVLLGAEAAFLLVAGVGINSYSKRFFPTNAAIRRLQSIVGSSLVGLSDGNSGYPGQVQYDELVGLYPNVNIGYGIDQFTGHDPALPKSYFTSWLFPVQYLAGGTAFFFPDIDSAAIARHYGISYILAGPLVTAHPPGTTLVATIAGERLYKVPGAARFAFLGGAGGASASGSSSGSAPAGGAGPDRVLAVTDEGNGSFTLSIDAPRPATLVVRETSVPGWHASALGRSLSLQPYEGVMQEVQVPAGRYVLHLWYWPERLTVGLGVALAGLLALVGYALWPPGRRLARRALRRP